MKEEYQTEVKKSTEYFKFYKIPDLYYGSKSPSKGEKKAPLGSITKLHNPPKQRVEIQAELTLSDRREPETAHVANNASEADEIARDSALIDRYIIQSASRELMIRERIRFCLRSVRLDNHVPGEKPKAGESSGGAKIMQASAEIKRYHYGNLIVCGSAWICPVCACKIAEKRGAEMRQATLNWVAQGGGILMLVLTLRHSIHDSLEKNLSALLAAYKLMLNRPAWKTLAKKMGIVGSIRVLETTYGQNGWHPHLHILLFTEDQLEKDPEAEKLQDESEAIYAQWASAVQKRGLPVPSPEHGVRLQKAQMAWKYIEKKAREGADGYASKTSWDTASEMTKQTIKKSRGGYHPFELLRKYAGLPGFESKDFQITPEAAAYRFREFAAHFQGKKQLLWSRGLRKMCGLTSVEKSNQELVEEKIEKAVPFATLTLSEWQKVLHNDKRGQVLAVCRQGLQALQNYIASLPKGHGFQQRMKDRKVEKMLHNPVVKPKRKGD